MEFLTSISNFVYLEKKEQLHTLNISEVIHSEKCSYLSAKKQLFQNTLRESTCSHVPSTAKIFMAALLLAFLINRRQIQLGNMSLD